MEVSEEDLEQMDYQRLLGLATYLNVVELGSTLDESGLKELIRKQQLRD